MVSRKKRCRGVARKKEKKRKKKAERESLEVLASGCPESQDVPSVRIPGVSCLASGCPASEPNHISSMFVINKSF